MTVEQMEAVREVADGRCERIAKPGHWRVYRDERGRVVFERFKNDPR